MSKEHAWAVGPKPHSWVVANRVRRGGEEWCATNGVWSFTFDAESEARWLARAMAEGRPSTLRFDAEVEYRPPDPASGKPIDWPLILAFVVGVACGAIAVASR